MQERIEIVVTEKGARTVKRNIAGIGKGATKAGGEVRKLRTALQTLGVALVLRQTVKTLASFSQAMSTVKAITNASATEFVDLTNKARDLGATTRFTATQAGEGMLYLARAGFETNEVLASIEGTLQLAQAGALDLGRAADIASNILQGFRLNVDQTGRVVDVLSLAANSANTNVEQLGDAMKFVAPVAAGLGISLEEATAAAGALSNAGLQASLAGTGLRRVLAELESPSTKTIRILASLGVATDQVKVSQVGLTGAVKELRKAGLDTGMALEVFGDRGGPAFEVMSSSLPHIQQMSLELQNAGGSAARVAAIMDDNVNGALLRVRSALEAIVLSLGAAGGEKALRGLLENTTTLFRRIAVNADTLAKSIKALSIIVSVLFVRKALNAAIVSMVRFNALVLANPFGALASAILVVTSIMVAFGDQIKINSNKLTTFADLGSAVFDVLSEGARFFSEVFNASFSIIDERVGTTFGGMGTTFENVVKAAAWSVDKLVGLFVGAGAAIVTGFSNIPKAFRDIFTRALNGAIKIVESGINKITGALNVVLKAVGLEGIGAVSLKKIRNSAKGGAAELGKEVAESFKKGFGSVTAVSDTVDTLFDLADAKAGERAAAAQLESINKKRAALKDMPKPTKFASIPQGTPLGGIGGGSSFKDLFKDLQQENSLLKLNTAEREAQSVILQFQDELKRKLSSTEKSLVENMVAENAALQTQSDVFDAIRGPQQEVEKTMTALNTLFQDGKITVAEYTTKLQELEYQLLQTDKTMEGGLKRGLISIGEQFTDIAGVAENTVVNSFKSAEDALADFVATGKMDFSSLIDSIMADMAKLAVRQSITAPLANMISGGGSSGSGLLGGLGSLFGFANGGDFTVNPRTSVGSLNGVDNRLVAFRARDGEKVSVTKPGQRSSGGSQTMINFNVSTPDAESFNRSQGQIMARIQAGMSRANKRNN